MNIDNMENEIEFLFVKREEVISDMIGEGQIDEFTTFDFPQIVNDEISVGSLDDYAMLNAVSLESNELLITDMKIFDLQLKINQTQNILNLASTRTKYPISVWIDYFNIYRSMKLTKIKIDICEFLDICADDYIYELNVLENDFASFKDNMGEDNE